MRDTLAGLAAQAQEGMAILERTVNGQPGLVMQLDGVTGAVFAFDIADGRISRLWAVGNPDKLWSWTAAG